MSSRVPFNIEDEAIYLSPSGFQRLAEIWDIKCPKKNFLWTTDHTFELPIRIRKKGSGSETPFTLIEAFEGTVRRYSSNPALRVKRNNIWIEWTYSSYFEDVNRFAKALIAINIKSNASINILGFNSPEWFIAFYGSIFANCMPVGIYSTNGPEACKYVTSHSEGQVIVLENLTQLSKYLLIWKDLPQVKYVVVYNDEIPNDLPEERKGKVMKFNDFLELGKKYEPKEEANSFEKRMKQPKPGNCCTLVYTSGTTANPKGVMISHDNYSWTASSFIKSYGFTHGKERFISYLPLSHVASQIVDLVSTLFLGSEVVFPEPSVLQNALIPYLREIRPTYFFGVPRIWEKIENSIKNSPRTTKILENWTKKQGKEGTLAQIQGKPLSFGFKIAKKFVYDKIKTDLGLDLVKHFVFGAAPMATQSREFFLSANMFLRNAYGMSESSGPQTYTNYAAIINLDNKTMGSCGVKMEGTEMFVDKPDSDGNGELCFKGRNRFMGYYKNEEETIKTIDDAGYIHSGDLARIDEAGNVTITGRIKELIITSGGENVTPMIIENQLKEEMPFLSNVIVIGDKRKYLIAIMTLKMELDAQGFSTEKIRQEGIKSLKEIFGDSSDFTTFSNVIQGIEEGVRRTNAKAVSRAQEIRKWLLVREDFTVAGGELTPTMKLKRKFTEAKHIEEIAKVYQKSKL